MWYFAWLLGLGLALALGIINVMWLESQYAFGSRSAKGTEDSFHHHRAAGRGAARRGGKSG